VFSFCGGKRLVVTTVKRVIIWRKKIFITRLYQIFDSKNAELFVNKIIDGGGVWGEQSMSALINDAGAARITFILNDSTMAPHITLQEKDVATQLEVSRPMTASALRDGVLKSIT
jgi:hypothetical protein